MKLGHELYGEAGIYILEGSIETEGNTYLSKQLLVAMDTNLCEFKMAENTTVYIFGGEPFAEDRFIYWNFVATSQELIDKAKENWLAQTFIPVPGETDFVPLPAENLNLKRK